MGERVISEKDKILDKVFWVKVIISLICGISYGCFQVVGFLAFLLFFVGMTILSFVYFKRIVSDEEVDYQNEVFVEGLNVSVPLFLLSWTIINTINSSLIVTNAENSTFSK